MTFFVVVSVSKTLNEIFTIIDNHGVGYIDNISGSYDDFITVHKMLIAKKQIQLDNVIKGKTNGLNVKLYSEKCQCFGETWSSSFYTCRKCSERSVQPGYWRKGDRLHFDTNHPFIMEQNFTLDQCAGYTISAKYSSELSDFLTDKYGPPTYCEDDE